MELIYDDGGRSNYFKGDDVGDCVTRAICNATDKDYKEVYDSLNAYIKAHERLGKHRTKHSTARNGVFHSTVKGFIENELGWVWHSTMSIGSGCTTHLDPSELPRKGVYIVKLSHHLTCVRDGIIYDTFDPSREGSRCVYGYWSAPNAEQIANSELEKKRKAIVAKHKKQAKENRSAIKQKYNTQIGHYKKQIAIAITKRDKEIEKAEEKEREAMEEELKALK